MKNKEKENKDGFRMEENASSALRSEIVLIKLIR